MDTAYETYRLSAQVWFVGVGPGHPELMTVRAHRLVQCADVLFHEGDQINQDILALRKKDAFLVNCHRFTPQEIAHECHRQLCQKNSENKLLVRLFTGDPCIFSPALEELERVQEMGLSCALVPGITAAFWAAALAQKSLTPKHTHQACTIMRVPSTSPLPTGQSIKDICRTGACMAIYLANKNPQNIVEQCLEAGLSPAAPILVIKSTGKNDEKITWLSLSDLPANLTHKNKTQSLVLIWP